MHVYAHILVIIPNIYRFEEHFTKFQPERQKQTVGPSGPASFHQMAVTLCDCDPFQSFSTCWLYPQKADPAARIAVCYLFKKREIGAPVIGYLPEVHQLIIIFPTPSASWSSFSHENCL